MKTLVLFASLVAATGSARAALIYSQTFDVFDDVPSSSVYFDAAPEYDGIVGGLTGADLVGNSNLNGKLITVGSGGKTAQSGSYFLHSNTLGTIPQGEVWGTNASQVVTVEIGTVYEFSFYLSGQNAIAAAVLSPRINGVELQGLTVDGVTNPAAATYVSANAGTWVMHTYRWEADTTTADLSLFNFTAEQNGNDFYLDTITFSSVPEPGTAMLGALGLLGLARRRR